MDMFSDEMIDLMMDRRMSEITSDRLLDKKSDPMTAELMDPWSD